MSDASKTPTDETPTAIPASVDVERADDDTLARLARHDSAAFAQLYRRHLDRVYRYLLVRLADVHQAQDLTAQTFLAALEGLARYRGEGEFAAWLLAIARHKAVDAMRHRPPTVPLEDAATMLSRDPSPEQVVAARLRLEQVARALRAIAPERAEALALRVFAGLSPAEIGAVMGKSEAAVKMLVSRAVRDLRQRLGDGADGMEAEL